MPTPGQVAYAGNSSVIVVGPLSVWGQIDLGGEKPLHHFALTLMILTCCLVEKSFGLS